jgi:hypothetical protein
VEVQGTEFWEQALGERTQEYSSAAYKVGGVTQKDPKSIVHFECNSIERQTSQPSLSLPAASSLSFFFMTLKPRVE